jgi:hypothetical protein
MSDDGYNPLRKAPPCKCLVRPKADLLRFAAADFSGKPPSKKISENPETSGDYFVREIRAR